ncbi:hypothetical protein IGI96_003880 [Enterococcus sp. DIV0421]
MNVVLNKKKCRVRFENYSANNNVVILLVRKNEEVRKKS